MNLEFNDSDYNNNIKNIENDNLLELVFEPDTIDYLKKSGYTIQSGNIHKFTLDIMLTKNSDTKRKIVSDLITKCYWDDNFLYSKEMTVNVISEGVTNKKSFRLNILYFLIQNDYPESIILKVLESNKVDLDIYDKNSNTLIHNVIYKKKYPNAFISLLELSDSEIINKKNNKGLNCWDIALEMTNNDFYLEKIISSGKFYFDDEFIKKYLEIIKEYCGEKNIDRNKKLYEDEYKYIYKILDFKKDLNLLNNYWKFYYDISSICYFEDVYQIVCVNKEKLELILNFIKFVGWYYNFDKNLDIDIDLFNSIDGKFLVSYKENSINYLDFYSGIQYILNNYNDNLEDMVKSKNYIEEYLDCKFYFSNIPDMKNVYKDYYDKIVSSKTCTLNNNYLITNYKLYLVLIDAVKNNVNIDLIKKYIYKILDTNKYYPNNIYTSLKFKINKIHNELKQSKNQDDNILVQYFIHNYNCDKELIKLYVEFGFFTRQYSFTPVKDDLFCKMIELNMYDKVYELIVELNLDYYYYFFKPSIDILSIFEYYLSIRNTIKSYEIIKKTGSIIFNYISIHKFDKSNKLNNFYKIAKNYKSKNTYPNDSALYWACKNKMTNIATFLLDNYLSDPNYTDSDGISVLSWACINSMESIGLRLLDIDSIDTSKLDLTNKSALNYAVENGLKKTSAKIIEILLKLIKK